MKNNKKTEKKKQKEKSISRDPKKIDVRYQTKMGQ